MTAIDKEFAVQKFPYPWPLEDVVDHLVWGMLGWKFELAHKVRDVDDITGETLSEGLTLVISVTGQNYYHPEWPPNSRVWHYRPVPPATYNRDQWRRWVFAQCMDVLRHEAGEAFLDTGEGCRPFAPMHGPGDDPYSPVEYVDEVKRRIRPDGKVVPISQDLNHPR